MSALFCTAPGFAAYALQDRVLFAAKGFFSASSGPEVVFFPKRPKEPEKQAKEGCLQAAGNMVE